MHHVACFGPPKSNPQPALPHMCQRQDFRQEGRFWCEQFGLELMAEAVERFGMV